MFKLGDRVIYTSGRWGSEPSNPLWPEHGGVVGTIIERGVDSYRIQWDNGKKNCAYENSDLQLFEQFKGDQIDVPSFVTILNTEVLPCSNLK